jgi:hypothetical protein
VGGRCSSSRGPGPGFAGLGFRPRPRKGDSTTGSTRSDAGEKPGLRIVFSSKPKSADYNPGNFNRISRWLADNEKPAPPLVEKGSRRLRDRP